MNIANAGNPLLSTAEDAVLNTLADAWNQFCALEVLHPSDAGEFVLHLHALQNIILARPAYSASTAHKGVPGHGRNVNAHALATRQEQSACLG